MAKKQLKEVRRLAKRRERLEAKLRDAIYAAVESEETFTSVATYARMDRRRVAAAYRDAQRQREEQGDLAVA